MKEQTTKERILEAAEKLMLERGFHSVGLKQILDTVKVPKGSFYHYFDSKDQFGAEMMKHYLSEVGARKRKALLSTETEPDPLNRLFAYLEQTVVVVQSIPGKFPCLALKLASEVSDLNEPMRSELECGFEDWISIYEELLSDAVQQKKLPETFDCSKEAQIIQDLWSGAVHRSVVKCNEGPVRLAVEHIETRLKTATC